MPKRLVLSYLNICVYKGDLNAIASNISASALDVVKNASGNVTI